MAQPKLALKRIAGAMFPLPPHAEQIRIVSKVSELMRLCDELEAAQAKREKRRDRLVTATLQGLNNGEVSAESEDGMSFEQTARFYFSHIPRLAIRPEHIQQLRQCIVDLGVRGRLVLRDENDEPAVELVQRIAARKANLVGEHRTVGKPCRPVQEHERVFPIPRTWTWVRVGDLILSADYGTSQKAVDPDTGVPVLTMGNVQNGAVLLSVNKVLHDRIGDLPKLFLQNLDLLYNRTNGPELVGKTGIFLGPMADSRSLHI